MAFDIIRQTEDGVPVYECLSTDTKETPQPLGAVAYETDTGDKYEYRGSAGWVQTDNAGSLLSELSSGSVWSYGNYPETWYSSGSWAGAADAATTTISSVESFNTFTMELHTLTATSATVALSLDGTNFTDVILYDLSTGALFATAAITATGIYQFRNLKFTDIRVTQAGAGAAEIRYSLGNT